MEIRFLFVINIFLFVNSFFTVNGSNDGGLNLFEVANKYGHAAEVHYVITSDGYILKLYRIRGKIEVPVLLMHGILDSSDTWIARGNTSLAITLANRGYDVWVGNCRGNRYGRNHLYLDPNSKNGFWDFTFHEIGYYDLSAIIDTVLLLTGASNLNAIGHSQGNAIFYVLGSTRPEYNEKVNSIVALAPIAFLNNALPPFKNIIELSATLSNVATYLNFQELLGDNSKATATWRSICPKFIIGYKVCVEGILFPTVGYDEDELESSFVPTLVRYFPTGTSLKNLNHFGQVGLRRKFALYDYGTDMNLELYKSAEPPEYNLSAVTMKVALFVGPNDKLATVEDAAILRQKLPNVGQLIIPRRKMNHVDFVLGRHAEDYLYSYIFDVLTDKENNK